MSESALRRRRGATRASLTRLSTRLRDLEGKTDEPNTLDIAQRLRQKLEDLKSDFMTHHLALVDAITDEDDLTAEQDILDAHDEEVTHLEINAQRLITSCSSSSNSVSHKVAIKRLRRIRRSLSEISDSLSGETDDVCRIRQHQEQLSDFKTELVGVRNCLLSMDLEEEDDLTGLPSEVEDGIFNVSLKIKRLLRPQPSVVGSNGIKLPKLEIPTFDGDIVIIGGPFGNNFECRCITAQTFRSRRSCLSPKRPERRFS